MTLKQKLSPTQAVAAFSQTVTKPWNFDKGAA